MHILAINSSPRTGNGSITELMLNHLVIGMQTAGAGISLLNLRTKKIKPCLGCFMCWTKTPGRCVQNDDMANDILNKLIESDINIYATPLYFNTMNSAMGIFRERMLPLFSPFIKQNKGKRVFFQRYKLPSAVWLSVCALGQESEFDPLSTYLHSTQHPDTPILAEIYRTSSEALRHPVFKQKLADILQATSQAGEELIQTKKISPDTMARINQPLADPKTLLTIRHLTFKECIANSITLQDFFNKGMTPRPDSLETFMAYSVLRLNGNKLGDRKVILQFRFHGDVEASCYFTFKRGNLESTAGTSPVYDVAIDTPFELWMDIITGKADGREMFMQRKYRVEGNLPLMVEIFQR